MLVTFDLTLRTNWKWKLVMATNIGSLFKKSKSECQVVDCAARFFEKSSETVLFVTSRRLGCATDCPLAVHE